MGVARGGYVAGEVGGREGGTIILPEVTDSNLAND